MYTQCPECRTIFEIDEEALQASFGIVHCGHCAKRFDALRSLSNTLPLDADAGLSELADEPRIPTLTTEVSAAQVAAAGNKYRRQRQSGDALADAEPLDADALLTDDNWFADLQADLAAELDRPTPSALSPTDPVADALAEPAELDVVSIPVAAPVPAEPAPIEPDADAAETGAAGPATVPDDAPSVAPPDVLAVPDQDADTGAAPEPAPNMPTGLVQADPEPVPASTGSAADPPAAADPAEPAPEPDSESVAAEASEPAATVAPVRESEVAAPVTYPEPATAAAAAADAAPDPVSMHGNVHMYVRPLRPRRPRTGLAWTAGCVALAVLLAAQIVWAERTSLYLHPSTHAWMVRVCQTLPCRLPPLHQPARLALVSRDIRPDPRRPGALSITATLRNDAGFREAWPVVVVVLTDIDNQPVAMRRFRPAEYMPDRARRAAGIAPGATVAVAFEVADPGKQARGFQFTFE